MINLKAIISGWSNLAFGEVEPKHYERAEVCSGCEHAVHGDILDRINDQIKVIQGYKCNQCGCPLSAKVRQDVEGCPLGKW